MKISAKFRECLPGCEIGLYSALEVRPFDTDNSSTEKASIDEAFFDLTRPVREILLERYPYLAHVPPDAPNGADTPLPPPPPIHWNGLGHVISIDKPPADGEQETKGGHTESREAENVDDTTWHDVALSIGAELMGKARDVVYKELGYSTSAVRRPTPLDQSQTYDI
jgi:DNA polymerase eta